MAPVQPRKRKSESSSPSASQQRSPIKKRKLGITLAQKQALIDNLQLEITERARRLRAQYGIQAQQLRSRVEMRVNRIPTTLRRLKMSELLLRSLQPEKSRPAPRSQYVAKPPPVPPKDGTSPKPIPRKPLPATGPARRPKRPRCGSQYAPDIIKLIGSSIEISGADKENQSNAVEHPNKKIRGGASHATAPITASQVLSPTSSNTRVFPRDRPASPTKPTMSRPMSPIKGSPTKPSSNILSSIVERAKAARPAAATKKTTASSTATSNAINASTAATSRARKTPVPPPSSSGTRGRRKVSVTSESSEGSTTTVVKQASTASKAAKSTTTVKKTVMSTLKSTASKKTAAAKSASAASTTTTTGRALRKRA